MKISNTLYVTHRDDWRAWLKKHHGTETEVWLIFYKKHTGKPRIPYGDAVEEALCYGWIDSIVKKVDDEKFAQKFSPRKDNSQWSEANIKRMRKLIKEKRMTKVGLAKFNAGAIKKANNPSKIALTVPPFMKQALMANHAAWENFNNLAPSYRRYYIAWVMDTKKEETRERRLKKAIARLKLNEKLGMV